MYNNFYPNNETIRTSNAVAAGTTTINCTHVLSDGSTSVLHGFLMGAIITAAVTSAKVQHGDLADDSDMADVTGLTVTIADTDDNLMGTLEYLKPVKKYSRLVISRATQNATLDGAFAVRRNVPKAPQVATGATIIAAGHVAKLSPTP